MRRVDAWHGGGCGRGCLFGKPPSPHVLHITGIQRGTFEWTVTGTVLGGVWCILPMGHGTGHGVHLPLARRRVREASLPFGQPIDPPP